MRTNQPKNEDTFKLIDSTFDGLDEQREQNLERLQTIQNERNKMLTREKVRLEHKYGGEHPRIQKIKSRIQYHREVANEIKTEVDHAKITVPNLDLNTWIVHGRVIEWEEGAAVEGVTVSIYDKRDRWVRKLGYACTDNKGYYAISYTEDISREKERLAAAKESGLDVEQPGDDFYLTVTDHNNNIIQRENEPLQIKKGQIDYRLIILKQSKCAPPTTAKSPDKMATGSIKCWRVQGKVEYNDRTPAENVTVSLSDKELMFDEMLGAVKTNKNGEFKAEYSEQIIKELLTKKPDLFVSVYDQNGKRLYRSRKVIKFVEKDIENLNITVKKNS